MNLLDELARNDIETAMLAQSPVLIEEQQAKLAKNNFKMEAPTFELAYCKRARFGEASRALVGERRLLFKETVDNGPRGHR